MNLYPSHNLATETHLILTGSAHMCLYIVLVLCVVFVTHYRISRYVSNIGLFLLAFCQIGTGQQKTVDIVIIIILFSTTLLHKSSVLLKNTEWQDVVEVGSRKPSSPHAQHHHSLILQGEAIEEVHSKVHTYKKTTQPDSDSNPLEWWKADYKTFPLLDKVAKKYVLVYLSCKHVI